MEILSVTDLTKTYDGKTALDHVGFSVQRGEFLSVLGPSGCGKTTLLRILIGLLRPDSGRILLEGTDITDFAPDQRKMGIVFQNYALFENMTVRKNIEYAMRLRPDLRANAAARATELIEQVGLSDHADKYPAKLSGGQQQRVAIARALALQPEVLCFDEPTSALDPELTGEVLKVIRGLKGRDNTMVVVTHEMEFARSVADVVIYMADGVIEEFGTPEEVFGNPRSEKTRNFLQGAQNARDGLA